MWLFTKDGFFSVVRKTGDEQLTVRARCADDLDRLRKTYVPELGKTITGAGSDYKFRAMVAQPACASALERIALDIDYGNFKNVVRTTLGSRRENQLHEVWRTMYSLQQEER